MLGELVDATLIFNKHSRGHRDGLVDNLASLHPKRLGVAWTVITSRTLLLLALMNESIDILSLFYNFLKENRCPCGKQVQTNIGLRDDNRFLFNIIDTRRSGLIG